MEKQAYALVKSLKSFRVYIMHSKIISYVPRSIVKDILIHHDSEGKKGRWIAKILEYDLEIRPSKPFPCIKVPSNNVNDVPWHASGKTSEGEGNVPRA